MSRSSSRTTCGKRLKLRRVELGMGQKEVASAAGITASQLCRIENGVHWPHMPTLQRLSQVLKINPGEFFVPEDEKLAVETGAKK